MAITRSVKVTIFFEVFEDVPPVAEWTWENMFNPEMMPEPPTVMFEEYPHEKPS